MTEKIKNFTISDLERFSGIKAHTLRVWERRYATINPLRSGGNCRLYSLDELNKVLNISLLNNNGYRISVLSKTSSEEIETKVRRISFDPVKWQKAINDLTINMYAMEPGSFDKMLDELLLIWPVDSLIEKIIYPFLSITGLLWRGNKLPEEHLVVTSIRRKLIFAIESSNFKKCSNKTVLLFLPGRDQLDLGLLYSNYFLTSRGIKVLYMGNDVSPENLKTILHKSYISCLFTYLPLAHSFPVPQLTEYLHLNVPGCKLVIGGYDYPVSNIVQGNLLHQEFKSALDSLVKLVK